MGWVGDGHAVDHPVGAMEWTKALPGTWADSPPSRLCPLSFRERRPRPWSLLQASKHHDGSSPPWPSPSHPQVKQNKGPLH